MSNKKSRKLINIMLSAMMLLGATNSYGAPQNNTSNLTKNDNLSKVDTGSPTSYGKIDGGKIGNGSTTNSNYGKNGVAYVLLSSDFSNPGVYRYNKYDGSIRDSYISKNLDPKSPLFKINTINGKVSGLAANQKNDVYLLSAIEGAEFNDAPIGWLPTGIKFDENSSIYLAVAGPSDGGATDYWRSGYPSWHSWPTDGKPSTGQYWKRDQTYKGKTYEYAVNFGGPVGVKFLNGVDNTDGTGCPIWDGTYKPESTSNAAAIRHPSDPQKVLLPSHVGALSYYLYGTKNESAIEGKPMDGTEGRDTYIFSQANGAGVFSGDSKHGYGTMFGCIVRRFYQKRENSLNLYSGNDTTTASNIPFDQTMTQTQANVLKTVDVKVKEAYGKLCGDNCIDGGEILGKPVETAISTVTVVTSTTGNRYGFNPLGVFKGSNSTDASLRVVKSNGTTQTIDIATDDEGTKFSNNITNTSYLMSKGITPASIKTIGVSSKFGSSGLDYIYGSGADYFVVQDSWWGKGGVAYEYYKGTDGNPGKVVKIDYVNKDNQTESDELGDLEGNIDAIAIDGDGYLYALKTEQSPADSTMEAISFDPNPAITEVGNDKLQVSYTEWRRDKQTTTANDETINDSYEVIPDGEEQPGDYKIATIVQNVFKTVKRYPQATGALGTEEDRGTMWAGHDEWINRLKKTSSGYTWDYPLWRQSEGTKASSLHGELAVVNVADSPVSIDGTTDHYIVVTGATNDENNSYTYTNNQVIKEQSSLTFKVEGYKPVVGGEQRKFKDIGDISDTYKDVKLNSIPAEDGTYAHDEDGDDNKSGFPSSMFEAKNYNTTVKWKIALVENTSAIEIGSSKQAGKLIDPADGVEKDVITISGKGDYKSLTYKFNQPGRYIIQAEVTYNYFDNFGSAERPTDLTSSTKSFTTKPKLIQVYANSLQLNKTPSYITNIKIERQEPNPSIFKSGVTGGNSFSMFDVVEGPASDTPEIAKNYRRFGSLKISFDAQFYREEESNTSGNLQTYDGIGVWDYQYYKALYEKAKNKIGININEIKIPSITDRAYNLIGDPTGNLDSINLTSDYNPNVYNPGKNKGDSTQKHKAGTEITGKPNKYDLSFIQYAIYLRPVTPQGSVSVNPMFERGDLIASGSFKDATLGDEISKRKYNITKIIDSIDSYINTPRDPYDYTLDLEIIYPRVTWLNNDLGANLSDGRNYFSSLVPYTSACGNSPIHVLSKLSINNGTNNIINQSYESDSDNIFADNAYYTICARDREIPKLINNTKNLPYYETTGDPTISGNFEYQVIDNNPYLSVSNNPTAKITEEEALSVTDLMTQDIINNKFITSDNSDNYYKKPSKGGNIKYSVRTDISKTATIDQTSESDKIDNKCFCATDSWRLWIDYTAKLESLSPERFKPHTKSAEAALTAKIDQLYMENWVGTLSYTIVGKFFDGFGEDTQSSPHYICNSDVLSSDSELPSYMSGISTVSDKEIGVATSPYLVRIDNDPPNIEVELVSQSDNRRWNYQLIEEINDERSESDPRKIKLSPSTLVVKQYKLSEATSAIGSYEVKNIAGTTAYKDNVYDAENSIGTMTVDLHKSQFNSIPTPSFRRAARLLINVNIFDNCGYLPLKEAWIEVSDNNGNSKTPLLPKKDIDPTACYNEEGKLTKFKANEKPRGVFYVNLPMQVAEGQDTNPQITVKVHAEDQKGNERELIIPVKLVESTFETRVLETKEERQ